MCPGDIRSEFYTHLQIQLMYPLTIKDFSDFCMPVKIQSVTPIRDVYDSTYTRYYVQLCPNFEILHIPASVGQLLPNGTLSLNILARPIGSSHTNSECTSTLRPGDVICCTRFVPKNDPNPPPKPGDFLMLRGFHPERFYADNGSCRYGTTYTFNGMLEDATLE